MALLFVASALIAQIVERFTWLIDLAAAVLAWTAAGLFLDDALVKSQFPALEPWGLYVRLGAVAFVLVIDLILRLARRRNKAAGPQVQRWRSWRWRGCSAIRRSNGARAG